MKILEMKEEGKEVEYAFYCEACAMHHSFNEGWHFNGDLNRPTVQPSILVRMGSAIVNGVDSDNYICHSYVTEGKIHYLSDCSHKLAGKIVKLQDIDNIEVGI